MNAPQNGTALAVVRPATTQTIEPRDMAELERLAKHAASTGFFGAKSPEQALIVMMAGRDLGLSYSQALRAFHVIEGKPTLSADGMVATCLVRRDVCEWFRTIAVDDKAATVETKRVGQEAQRYTFTMQDAQRAGVTNKPTWGRYPSRMLLARARAALARDVYPDLLLGLYDPDELETPPPAPAAAPAPRAQEMAGEVISAPATAAAPAAPAEDPAAPFVARFDAATSWDAFVATEADVVKARFGKGPARDRLVKAHAHAKARLEEAEAKQKADAAREPGQDDEEDADAQAEAYFQSRRQ